MQFFFVSTDRTVAMPIGFCITTGVTAQWLVDRFLEIIRLFSPQVEITWGSTDGFAGSRTFVNLMRQSHPKYRHIFDYVHVVKLLRNALLAIWIKTPDCPTGFCIRTLTELTEKDPKFRSLISKEDLLPQDKMDLDPVLLLMSAPVLNYLKCHADPTVRAIHDYLYHMNLVYNSISDNSRSLDQKRTDIAKACSYFRTSRTFAPNSISSDVMFHLDTIQEFLQHFEGFGAAQTAEGEQSSTSAPTFTSHYGTNVVENFFSHIRRKCRYPNLFEYSYTYQSAVIELIKRNCTDETFPFLKTGRIGKKYNNNDLEFELADIELASKASRAAEKQSFEANMGTEHDKLACVALAEKYKCSRKILLIREVTMKGNPFLVNRVRADCPIQGCTRVLGYVYPHSMTTHIRTRHADVASTEKEATELTRQAFSAAKEKEAQQSEEPDEPLDDSFEIQFDNLPDDELPSIMPPTGSCSHHLLPRLIYRLKHDLSFTPVGSSANDTTFDLSKATVIVWDTETNGFLSKERHTYITNISLQELDGDPESSAASFTAFVGLPDGVHIPQAVRDKIPITEELLVEKQAKLFKEVVQDLMAFLRKYESVILVAHNSKSFDEHVLRREFSHNRVDVPASWRFLDSKPMLKQWNSDLPKGQFTVENLYINLCDSSGFNAHLAREDTVALTKVIRATTQKRFQSSTASQFVKKWFWVSTGMDQPQITEYLKSTNDNKQSPAIQEQPATNTRKPTTSTKQKLFTCTHCASTYSSQGWLDNHVRRVHAGDVQQPKKRKASCSEVPTKKLCLVQEV